MSSGVVILLISCSMESEAGSLPSKLLLFIGISCEISLIVLNFRRGLGKSVGLNSE